MIGAGIGVLHIAVRGGSGVTVPHLTLSGPQSISEGAANGTTIATLSIAGTVTGTAVFAVAGADAAKVAINSSTGVITKNAAIDYETQTTLALTLSASGVTPAVASIAVTFAVTNVAAPTLSAPTDTATGSSTATLGVTTDVADGTLYAVVTTSATPPSAAQVKAGQNQAGAAAAFAGSQAISSTGAKTINATGLSASTAYFSYFMHEGLPSEQSLVAAADGFTTTALSPPVNTVLPAVTGTTTVGSTLTTTNGTWTNSPSSYAIQWYDGLLDGSNNILTDGSGNPLGSAIVGETGSTYVVPSAGHRYFATVIASNAGGASAPADSNVTALTTSGSSTPDWIKSASPAISEAAATSHTFTGTALGALGSGGDRLTIILVNTHTAVATGVTVGLLSATKVVEEATEISGLQLWQCDTSSLGATANIVVSGASMDNVGIMVGRLVGCNATATTSTSKDNGLEDPATITRIVPTGGFGIVGMAGSFFSSASWSNATQDYSLAPANVTSSGEALSLAHTSTAGSQTPSFPQGSTRRCHMVAACWGP